MPAQMFEIIHLVADILIFAFVGYFFLVFRRREEDLKLKESKADTQYHQVVDNALNKERKILDDATVEADKIINDARYVNRDLGEKVNQALLKMVTDIQTDAVNASNNFLNSYQSSLGQLSVQSLSNYQNISKALETDLQKFARDLETALAEMAKGLGTDLQKQIKDFHESLLPALEKELEAYKQMRIKQADQTITEVVQRVAQEVLNKSLTIPDHQALLTEALEKAKKEGVFD
jgi:vacuolar-type H+-ATPase subunit H